jgi:hypothetical protein
MKYGGATNVERYTDIDQFVKNLSQYMSKNSSWFITICYKPNSVFADINAAKPIIDQIYEMLKVKNCIV